MDEDQKGIPTESSSVAAQPPTYWCRLTGADQQSGQMVQGETW